MRSKRNWMLGGALAATCAMASQGVGAAQSCADLIRPGLFPNTVVQSAAVVPANATTGMPAYCEVTAVIAPVANSRITVVYRLPGEWNGRMLGLGGGGFAGNLYLSLPFSGPGRAASVGLPRGYATAQTDGGHSNSLATDVSWTRNNLTAVTDFSHRAIHEMLSETVASIESAVAPLTDEQARQVEAKGKWSVASVVQHLADAEVVWAYRIRMVLAEDRPQITGWDQDRWAERLRYHEVVMTQALSEFGALRRMNLRLLSRVRPDDLNAVGIHAERGRGSGRDLLVQWAGHDLLHLSQLARIRSALRGAAQG